MLKLKIKDAQNLIPDAKIAAQAAARGVEVLVIDHLREKNRSTAPSKFGLPKSNYYAEAAENVEAETDERVARVEVDYPGIALHYEGGTVYPKKKALAIPIDPSVATIWPSEANGIATGDGYTMFWPKNSSHGFIKDAETNTLLWLLVPKADIPADPTVLPTDESILSAAEAAVWEAFS